MAKDFKSGKHGLDAIIQSTAPVKEEIEIAPPVANTVVENKKERKVKETESERQITLTIPASLRKEIKRYCANNDVKIKDLIIQSVSKYMKDNV